MKNLIIAFTILFGISLISNLNVFAEEKNTTKQESSKTINAEKNCADDCTKSCCSKTECKTKKSCSSSSKCSSKSKAANSNGCEKEHQRSETVKEK